MSRTAFVNGQIILPDEILNSGSVICEAGKIIAVGSEEIPAEADIIDARGGYISPGFIDIHVHGGDGADFMDGTVEAVQAVCRAHLRHGTTTLFPTGTTGSPAEIMDLLQACGEARLSPEGARIAGVHLYGPYFAENKVGCHSRDGRREPLAMEYETYFETGLIRIATCAAELPGAADFYRMARDHKCLVTCGHSNSSWTEMQAAFENGMRHVDHFWCAMSSVPSLRQRFGVPMQASMAEFVLMNPEMSTEVIADGHHLAPELLEFAYRMKGSQRLCLVTDCNRALDMPSGKYWFGRKETGSWFESDGQVGWAPDGNLASSVVGLDHMVRHMQKVTSAKLPEVIRMASLTPAELTGIDQETGSISVGKRADLVLLDADFKVREVYMAGTLAHRY